MKQSAIAMLLALMLLFSACAAPTATTPEPQATPETTTTPEAREKTTLRILVGDRIGCDLGDYMAYFNEQNPDVSLMFVGVDHSHDHEEAGHDESEEEPRDVAVVHALLSGEVQADVILLDSLQAYRYLAAGVLEDLSASPALESALKNPNLLPGIDGICRQNGLFYGVPAEIAYQGFVVNKALFDRYAMPYPSPEWTHRDFHEMAARLSAFEGIVSGENHMMYAEDDTRYFNESLGIDVANRYAVQYDAEAFAAYLRQAKITFDRKLNAPPVPGSYTSAAAYLAAQKSDDLFLNFVYHYDLHAYETGALADALILPLPKNIQGGVYVNASMLGISATAQEKQLAEAFISSFFDEGYQRQYAAEMMLYSDKSAYAVMSRIDDNVEAWIAQTTVAMLPAMYADELVAWLDASVTPSILDGSLSVEESLPLMQQKAQELYGHLAAQ